MRDRRQGRTILIVLAVVAVAGLTVFLGQIFAQEPGMEAPGEPGMEPGMQPPGGPGMEPGMAPPGGPGMEPGMGMEPGLGMEPGMGGMEAGMMGGPGMMGAPGPGAGSGGLQWTDIPMPEDLEMTYDEFLAQEGMQRALIPEVYLYDSEGVPKKNTVNEWKQLQRIYAGRAAVAAGAVRAGKPGYGLAARINREIAVKERELEAIEHLYNVGLDSFTFEIGYPQVDSANISPGVGSVPVQIGVLMKPKPGVEKRFPSLVYRKLKPFDNYGTDRQLFRVVDYEGGIWNPKELWLWNGTVSEWNSLWAQNQVQLTLYDTSGDDIVSGVQSAGHSGGICAQLVHPPEVNFSPMYEAIYPPRGLNFEGGDMNLPYKKGWYFNFSFTIPISQLSALDRAEAVLIGAGGREGSRAATQASVQEVNGFEATSSRAALQAGAAQAAERARTGLPMMGAQIPPGLY